MKIGQLRPITWREWVLIAWWALPLAAALVIITAILYPLAGLKPFHKDWDEMGYFGL